MDAKLRDLERRAEQDPQAWAAFHAAQKRLAPVDDGTVTLQKLLGQVVDCAPGIHSVYLMPDGPRYWGNAGNFYAHGFPVQWNLCRVKTWKTRPGDFAVVAHHHGFRDYESTTITHLTLQDWTTIAPLPVIHAPGNRRNFKFLCEGSANYGILLEEHRQRDPGEPGRVTCLQCVSFLEKPRAEAIPAKCSYWRHPDQEVRLYRESTPPHGSEPCRLRAWSHGQAHRFHGKPAFPWKD